MDARPHRCGARGARLARVPRAVPRSGRQPVPGPDRPPRSGPAPGDPRLALPDPRRGRAPGRLDHALGLARLASAARAKPQPGPAARLARLGRGRRALARRR
ncbi:MAG: hypothetical protein F4X67_14155 [Gemmatimonadales bacterium]|nr:hypothetical protein [Gemmatimonadales bacterium]